MTDYREIIRLHSLKFSNVAIATRGASYYEGGDRS